MYTKEAFCRSASNLDGSAAITGLTAGGTNLSMLCRSCSRNPAAGGEELRNCPGRTKGSPKTISAEERPQSSFGAARSPSRTQGSCESQSWLTSRARRASFSCDESALPSHLLVEGMPSSAGEIYQEWSKDGSKWPMQTVHPCPR
jgi:hypothetical protein